MKIKSFWNKGSPSLTPSQLEMEKKLLPRLFLMGYIFIALSLSSLLFIVLIDPKTLVEEMSPLAETLIIEDEFPDELELQVTEVLNFYAISLIFASLATTCFYLGKIKKRELFQEVLVTKEEEGEAPSADS